MSFRDASLTRWLEEASPDRGLHFAVGGDSWDYWSYERLSELTMRAAAAFAERGLGAGDVVVVVARSSQGFVATVFGAMARGMTVCSIAPPFALQRADSYQAHVSRLLADASPALVVCDSQSAGPLQVSLSALGLPSPVVFDELVAGLAPVPVVAVPPGAALLQFTSGSSGFSRGALIPADALRANISAMRRWLRWEQADSGISWLPVHHDMGLVGCLMNIVVNGCNGWLLQPEDFIRSPLRYLTCISERSVTLAALPGFGLAYILRRVQPIALRGLHFESLRAVILGAERIDPRVLRAVEELLGPHGFDRRALLPAYGSAEATLAVTGLRPGTGWTARSPGGRRGTLSSGTGAEIVGCGRPLDGVTVRIVDDSGTPVREGAVGEIVVTGPSVATGYVGQSGRVSSTRLDGATLHTGDAGFLAGGQLYVLGRLGDGLKVRSRMIFAESLELELFRRGIPERRAAVVLGVLDGAQTAAVIFENEQDGWAELAVQVLRESLDEADLMAVNVPRGGLAVTSSGKPRRRAMWKALCESTLCGEIRPLARDFTPDIRGEQPA